MHTRIQCPNCRQALEVEGDSVTGQPFDCPSCGQSIEIEEERPKAPKRQWLRRRSRMVPCVDCGREISRSAMKCIYCGSSYLHRLLGKIVIGFAVLIIWGAVVSAFEGGQTGQAKASINGEWSRIEGLRVISGVAVASEPLVNPSIRFQLLDRENQIIGGAADVHSGTIYAGERWKFEAVVYDDRAHKARFVRLRSNNSRVPAAFAWAE